MKKLIVLSVLTVIVLSSCRSTRSGCPDTWDKVGYR
jgi:predicted small secreted protein